MRRRVELLVLALLASSLQAAPAPSTSQELDAALQEYWTYLLQSPGLRLRRGLPVEELPDVSLDAARVETALGWRLLRVRTLDPTGLSDDELDTLGVLAAAGAELLESETHYWVLPKLTPYVSPLRQAVEVFEAHAFAGAGDGERYVRLLDGFAKLVRQLEATTRGQAERGIRMPKAEIALALPPIVALRRPPAHSPFRPAMARLDAIPAPERERLLGTIDAAIAERIDPALSSLVAALGEEYAAAAPAAVGLGQYRGGAAAYRHLVRVHTTLDVGPDEVHAIGLREMERIEGELDGARRALGFQGTLAEFRRHLRQDPSFFARRSEDIGAKLMAAHARILPLVPRYFGRVPAAEGGVERLDPALEGAMTFGYYDPPRPDRRRGLYYYNGSRPTERSLLFAAPLIYHELVPGHHFQIGLQRENSALPPARQETLSTAFVEGWAEYASDLAGEMGLYADPRDRVGRLMMDSFLAARLVVDTGMNALGWSREQAMDYLRQKTFQSESEIATETLRYSCDIPGQALAYKMGALHIRALRERAARELGQAFDIRRFHDAVLTAGSLPLRVLEQRVERWIAAEKAAKG